MQRAMQIHYANTPRNLHGAYTICQTQAKTIKYTMRDAYAMQLHVNTLCDHTMQLPDAHPPWKAYDAPPKRNMQRTIV